MRVASGIRDGADPPAHYDALAVYEEGRGHSDDAVVDGYAPVVVDAVRVRHDELGQVRTGIVLGVLVVDTHERHAALAVGLPGPFEGKGLVPAGGAPRRPEVDDHGSAFQLRQGQLAAIEQGNCEARRRTANQRVAAPACRGLLAGEAPGHQGNEGERRRAQQGEGGYPQGGQDSRTPTRAAVMSRRWS